MDAVIFEVPVLVTSMVIIGDKSFCIEDCLRCQVFVALHLAHKTVAGGH